ncbi:MAG: hypothetical protein JWP91_3201 [Fibrobacteres bacterium]|nr:hypothetical protein [Fibrobacterota bacterium]
MRHSRNAFLSLIIPAVLFTACSKGGSPVGLAAETDLFDDQGNRMAAPSGKPASSDSSRPASDSALSAVSADSPSTSKDPGSPADPAKDSATASVETPPAETAKPMSAVDSLLAAGTKPVQDKDPVLPPADSIAVPKDIASPVATLPPVAKAAETAMPASPVFLNADFEGESLDCWNGNRSDKAANSAGCGEYKSIGFKPFALAQGGIAHSGTKAIDITYTKNEEMGGTNVGINTDSVNVRAFYYFEPGFDFGQGMKIGRVSSFNSAKQTNDVDIILEIRSSQGGNQCGVTDSRDFGLFFNGAPKGNDWGNVASNISFERGRWYAIEYQVVLNHPGKSDGAVRLWIDGAQVAAREGVNIRGSLSDAAKLNTVKIGGWYSNGANGNSACANPSQPSKMHMDDFAIARSFIGMGQPALAGNP